MTAKEPLPEGLKPKSPHAVLNNLDVGLLCRQLFALPETIWSFNRKNKKR